MIAISLKGKPWPATSLRKCVSAGEALPAATRKLWRDASGLEIIDGIGSTELLHIFVSADEKDARPGATGKAVPGYIACVMDAEGRPLPPGQVGALAIKGPTGCKYLADARQSKYVRDGWNYTGDAYLLDEDGYFHYQSRTDDMISRPATTLPARKSRTRCCATPTWPNAASSARRTTSADRSSRPIVVLKPTAQPTPATAAALQDYVKQGIAPYKYPRAIEFRLAAAHRDRQAAALPAAQTERRWPAARLRAGATHPLRALRPGRHRLLPAVSGDGQQPDRGVGHPRLGLPYADLIGRRRTGLPTVSLQCEFTRRQPHGRRRDPGAVGRAHGRQVANATGRLPRRRRMRMSIRQVLVTTDLNTHRAIDIPADLRTAIDLFATKGPT